jgi:hypothetical protein
MNLSALAQHQFQHPDESRRKEKRGDTEYRQLSMTPAVSSIVFMPCCHASHNSLALGSKMSRERRSRTTALKAALKQEGAMPVST